MRRLLWVGLILFFVPVAAAGDETVPLALQTTRLAANLHLLSGPGGNVVVAAADSAFLLVDSGYGPASARLREAIAAIGPLPVRWIVNTHWHFDHVGGNREYAEEGARIAAHGNVRRRMAAGQAIGMIDAEIPPADPVDLPVVTFADSIRIHMGTTEVFVFHPGPAHTDGDAVVVFPGANLVHAGDIFFNCGYPFVDLWSGGSVDGMIAAVDRILGIGDEATRIVPGHGPMATKADLRSYRTMLADFRAIVAREIDQGRCLEEILERKPTAELDARYGGVFFSPEQFTELVYRSLTDAK